MLAFLLPFVLGSGDRHIPTFGFYCKTVGARGREYGMLALYQSMLVCFNCDAGL